MLDTLLGDRLNLLDATEDSVLLVTVLNKDPLVVRDLKVKLSRVEKEKEVLKTALNDLLTMYQDLQRKYEPESLQ